MHKILGFIGVALVIILVVFGLQKTPLFDDRPVIAVTIPPLADIATQLFGDQVRIVQLVPNGASPHTYQITPKQAAEMSEAVLVFAVGHGLDEWALQGIEDTRIQLVDDGVSLREYEEDEHEDEDAHEEDGDVHEGVDPHYWLSYINAQQIINVITQRTLAEIELENEEEIRLKARLLMDKFAQARQEKVELVRSSEAPVEIITFHDAFAYLAEDIGFTIVDHIQPFAGQEPTPQELARLQEVVSEYGITVLFTEPQLASQTVSSLLEDMGLELRILDPLGGVDGRVTYLEMLEYNVREIIR